MATRSAKSSHFYPRPPGGGRPGIVSAGDFRKLISIHALRVEGDCTQQLRTSRRDSISIHALRVEGDLYSQSGCDPRKYFYPRPPGGGRLLSAAKCSQGRRISIHALRVEGDRPRAFSISLGVCHFYPRPPGGGRLCHMCRFANSVIFLSTPSGWRATSTPEPTSTPTPISIHALRVEGDSKNGQSFRLFLRKREKNLPL